MLCPHTYTHAYPHTSRTDSFSLYFLSFSLSGAIFYFMIFPKFRWGFCLRATDTILMVLSLSLPLSSSLTLTLPHSHFHSRSLTLNLNFTFTLSHSLLLVGWQWSVASGHRDHKAAAYVRVWCEVFDLVSQYWHVNKFMLFILFFIRFSLWKLRGEWVSDWTKIFEQIVKDHQVLVKIYIFINKYSKIFIMLSKKGAKGQLEPSVPTWKSTFRLFVVLWWFPSLFSMNTVVSTNLHR